MITFTITPTVAPQSLYTALASPVEGRTCRQILLQTPSGNSTNINYGGHRNQPFQLAANTTLLLEETSPKNLWLYGNGADTVNVGLIQ